MVQPHTVRSDDEIKEIIESAFKPGNCAVRILPYEDRMQFRVWGRDGDAIVRFPKLMMRDAKQDHVLAQILGGVRSRIMMRGISLDDWQFPRSRY